MASASKESVTELLARWNAGDRDSADEVVSLVYEELRRIAQSYFHRERDDHTLQATAIVHEAYVRLTEQTGIEWRSRAHFIGFMAHLMRRILVDYAREHHTARRGGRAQKVTLVEATLLPVGRPPDLMAVDEALNDLAKIDPRKASIVELRFFGGLSLEETAEYLAISPATVSRQWRRARAWLFHRLGGDESP